MPPKVNFGSAKAATRRHFVLNPDVVFLVTVEDGVICAC